MNSKNFNDWKLISNTIVTRWAELVSPDSPLPEYPRPQLKRPDWLNLNGLWDYSIRPKDLEFPDSYDGKILVPFPLESPLSGVKKRLLPKQKLWYRRFFKIPSSWHNKNVLLHFGAVDWKSTIWLNGSKIGSHKGGFTPFYFNISNHLDFNNSNELVISVWDPTGRGCQERGKQLLHPFMIYYTAVSGIWQTVWLEPVPDTFIESIKLIPDIDSQSLSIYTNVYNPKPNDLIFATIFDNSSKVSSKSAPCGQNFSINISNPKLWSPNDPFLYDLTIEIIRNDQTIDSVQSYFGMRKISLGKDHNGITRIFLNNNQIFQYGTLDQGYWPDGLYTAPTDSALKFDIETTKDLGFNMIRKHVKIEPARWYYHCDKIGILVWQDMPNGGRSLFIGKKRSKSCKDNYYSELESMINSLFNFPCIVVWIPFNEGWGQFDTKNVVSYIKNLDPSRLVNNASGWFDKKIGDIHDIHKYPGPKCPKLEQSRAAVLGEFGGLGLKIQDHLWNIKKHNWSYKKSLDPSTLLSKYTSLIHKLIPLINSGLCAAVYTQFSDIEGEINGLLTYDRKVIKIDPLKLKSLHASLF
ncbi:MAG: glycoside hydrolase family 2 protein [Candidatus Helarchaeota archaeon]